jgi:hypothetical protein
MAERRLRETDKITVFSSRAGEVGSRSAGDLERRLKWRFADPKGRRLGRSNP